MEFTLLAAALTGVAALWVTLRLTGAGAEFEMAITAAISGLFVGRLVAMLSSGVNPITNPLDILLVRGGVDTVGATVGALGYLLWSGRRDRGRLRAVAPAAVAAVAGWHAGCLWRGSCLGTVGDVPWGWALAGSDLVRHPVELYVALLLGAAILLLLRLPAALRPGLALAAVAGARLVTEPLRPGLGSDPSWWYAGGILVGLAWAVASGRQRGQGPLSPARSEPIPTDPETSDG